MQQCGDCLVTSRERAVIGTVPDGASGCRHVGGHRRVRACEIPNSFALAVGFGGVWVELVQMYISSDSR